jgi:uncharacterized protein YchJ
VVRARYSAYAKRDVDFIIASTHPLTKNFITDIEHWKETIRTNCYDNFELTNCEIVDETYDGEGEKEIANVKFIAKMTQVDSKEKTAFMETSLFERAVKHIANGAWLYKVVIAGRARDHFTYLMPLFHIMTLHHIQTQGTIETAPGMPEPIRLEAEEVQQ